MSEPFVGDAGAITFPVSPTSGAGVHWVPAAFLGLWLVGVAIVAVARLRLWRRLRATVAESAPCRLGDVEIPAGLNVRSASGLIEPGVVGWRRPILLVPSDIAEHLTTRQLEAVLAHELCHIRRRDNLTAAAHMVVETLFWFHPLVWWIGARLIAERERACDEAVLSHYGDGLCYAEAIVAVCKRYVETPLACVSGVSGADLRGRLEAIIRNRVGIRLSGAKRVILGSALIAAFGIPMIVGSVGHAQSTPVTTAVAVAQEVYRAGDGISAPTVISRVLPKYPREAVDARVEGRVVMTGVVQTDGRITEVRVTQSVDKQLDAAAVNAVRQWRFAPGKKEGKAVAVRSEYDVTFTLQTSTPSFDVTSVKIHGDATDFPRFTSTSTRLTAVNVTVRMLLRNAFGLRDFEMSGGPDWIDSDHFDVTATAEAPAPPDQIRERIRTLLRNRFGLQSHTETREVPVFVLSVARRDGRLGDHITPSGSACAAIDLPNYAAPPALPAGRRCPWVLAPGMFIGRAITFGQMATMLAGFVGRPILDRTNVSGEFDFDLHWRPDELPSAGSLIRLPQPIDPNAPALQTATQEQLGLRLDSTNGPQEILVIDRLTHPEED